MTEVTPFLSPTCQPTRTPAANPHRCDGVTEVKKAQATPLPVVHPSRRRDFVG